MGYLVLEYNDKLPDAETVHKYGDWWGYFESEDLEVVEKALTEDSVDGDDELYIIIEFDPTNFEANLHRVINITTLEKVPDGGSQS